MKPTPEFENEICKVWKLNLCPLSPLSLWTRLKDTLIIPAADSLVKYTLGSGVTQEAFLKAHHPWECDFEANSLEVVNLERVPIDVMLIEIKKDVRIRFGSFPSIPMN